MRATACSSSQVTTSAHRASTSPPPRVSARLGCCSRRRPQQGVDMSAHKVILWGPGGVGEYVLRYLQTQPELELVGVRAYSPEKEGKDVAELFGLEPSGVEATQNVDELLALGADCV